MIFSGSSKVFNTLLRLDLATRENRSNKFMFREVLPLLLLRGTAIVLLLLGTKLDLDTTIAGEKASLEAANRHARTVEVTLNLTMFVVIVLSAEINIS